MAPLTASAQASFPPAAPASCQQPLFERPAEHEASIVSVTAWQRTAAAEAEQVANQHVADGGATASELKASVLSSYEPTQMTTTRFDLYLTSIAQCATSTVPLAEWLDLTIIDAMIQFCRSASWTGF